jgi:iron complex transport system substrate-binding protein
MREIQIQARMPDSSFNLVFYNEGMSERTPHRIACLQPSATVILASLGALDRVVACTRYCADVVPEVLQGKRRIIHDSWSAKASEILAAQPDLAIAAVPYQQEAVSEILKAGVRFLALAPRTLADIYTDIALIASIVGANEEANRVISGMETEIEAVRRKVEGLPRKRVFCEEWGKPVIASQAWVAELVRAAGGEFLGDPGRPCSPEEIPRRDPEVMEVMIAAWCGAGDRVPLPRIVRQRGWSGTTAAKTSQVYCISDELLNTPAPTLLSGLQALAAAIHPQAFPRARGLRSITHRLDDRDERPQRVGLG